MLPLSDMILEFEKKARRTMNRLQVFSIRTIICCALLAGITAGADGPPPVDPARRPPQGLEHYGWTALHWAARTGSAEDVRRAIGQGLDLEERDNLKRTPLHLAVLAVNTDTVLALLEAGADVNSKDQWGVTPLRRAELLAETRGWRMAEIAQILSDHGGVKPEQPAPRTLQSLDR